MIKTILFCIWFFSFLGTWGMFISYCSYTKKLHLEKNSSPMKKTFSAKLAALMIMAIISIIPVVNTFYAFVSVVKNKEICDKIEEDVE